MFGVIVSPIPKNNDNNNNDKSFLLFRLNPSTRNYRRIVDKTSCPYIHGLDHIQLLDENNL